MTPAKRLHLVAAAIIFFLWIPVLSSANTSIMGEVFKSGDTRETLPLERSVKSLHAVETAPVIQPGNDYRKEDLTSVSGDSIPLQIGLAMQTDRSPDPWEFKNILDWEPVQDGGHTATLIVQSPGALALRAGIIFQNLPQTAECRFFEIPSRTGEAAVMMTTGSQIHQLLLQNRILSPNHPDIGIYWSPLITGEQMGLEIYLPPGVPTELPAVAVPYISHIFSLPGLSGDDSHSRQDVGDSNSCQNDATCYAGWEEQRNAVAKMVFTESGNSYSCTGTLLNDTDGSSQIPYFVTANHCIGSQQVASTLQTYWFFESIACDSRNRHPDYAVKSGGSALLWTKGLTRERLDSNQDLTLLRLNDTPPDGAMLAGWSTFINPYQMTGIHHPSGDWKKISFGNPDEMYKCWDINGDNYSCVPSSTGSFLHFEWTDGGTEGGSSGSGLFNDKGQLVGTLLGGGGGDCAGSNSEYSSFGAAYESGDLSQWLDPVDANPPVLGTVILTVSIPDITLPAGSDALVYGTSTANQVTLESGAQAVLINFPGPNTIQIESASSLFSVSRSGTIVFLQGSDGTSLKIPASTEVQTVTFSDTVMTLTIHNGRVLLDDQVVTPIAVPVG